MGTFSKKAFVCLWRLERKKGRKKGRKKERKKVPNPTHFVRYTQNIRCYSTHVKRARINDRSPFPFPLPLPSETTRLRECQLETFLHGITGNKIGQFFGRFVLPWIPLHIIYWSRKPLTVFDWESVFTPLPPSPLGKKEQTRFTIWLSVTLCLLIYSCSTMILSPFLHVMLEFLSDVAFYTNPHKFPLFPKIDGSLGMLVCGILSIGAGNILLCLQLYTEYH